MYSAERFPCLVAAGVFPENCDDHSSRSIEASQLSGARSYRHFVAAIERASDS